MRRKMFALVGAAGLALSAASVVRAATTFTENFNSGDVTDGGVWSTGVVSNPSNVSFTEPVGGPLTIGVSGAAAGTTEGGYIQTTSQSTCNPITSPLLMTVTAPVVNNVQQSLLPSANTNFNSAETMLGVAAPGQRLDSGPARAYVYLNGGGNLQFSLEFFDPTKTPTPGNNFVNQGVFGSPLPTITPTTAITSMWIYLDGSPQGQPAGATYSSFWIDFGLTYVDTSTNSTGSFDWAVDKQHYAANPYTDPATGKRALNITSHSPYFASYSDAQIQSMMSEFATGAVGELEVLANSNNGSAGNTVSFGQLSVVTPEPASLSVLAIAGAALLRRRRA